MIAIVIVLGLAAVALGTRKRASATAPPETEAPAETWTFEEHDVEGKAPPELPNLGLAVTGAIIVSEVSSQIAYQIGGTELARNVGRVGLPGIVAVASAEVGQEIDKALGGTEGTLRSDIAQGGSGAVGGIAALLGPQVATLGITGMLIVVPLILGLAQLALLAYAIAWIWDESTRLAKGQAGALEEYKLQWAKLYGPLYDELRRNGRTDADANRIAFAMTDGYMQEANKRAFAMWMRRTRPALQSAYQHAIAGMDRAWFVGSPDSSASYLFTKPPLMSDDSKYRSWVPMADRVNPQAVPITEVRRLTDIPVTDVGKYKWESFNPKANRRLNPITGETVIASYYGDARIQVGAEIVYQDRMKQALMDAGATLSNFAAYVGWMNTSKGLGQTDKSHAEYGQKEGRFVGVVDDNGALRFKGAVLHYKDVK